jgi:hypothetical protein
VEFKREVVKRPGRLRTVTVEKLKEVNFLGSGAGGYLK